MNITIETMFLHFLRQGTWNIDNAVNKKQVHKLVFSHNSHFTLVLYKNRKLIIYTTEKNR